MTNNVSTSAGFRIPFIILSRTCYDKSMFYLKIRRALRIAIRVGVVGRASSRAARARCYVRRYELRRVASDYAATEAYKTTIKLTIVTVNAIL